MSSALPSNLHAELALDHGRLSHDGPERVGARNIAHSRTMAADRVQSLHGVIVEEPQYHPSHMHGAIMEEPDTGMLSGSALAAALEDGWGEDDYDEEVIGPQHAGMHGEQYYDQRGPNSPAGNYYATQSQHLSLQGQQIQQRNCPPRKSSLNSAVADPYASTGTGSDPKSILQNRSDSLSAPAPHFHDPSVPMSAPPQQQSFPDRPRFALTDDGPSSAPPSPGRGEHGYSRRPGVQRSVSDSYFPQQEQGRSSQGVTPPLGRGNAKSAPLTPSKYATFQEMGIEAKGAQKEKDCIIM